MLNRKKIALVHVAKKEIGLSEELFRRALRIFGGVESTRDLDEDGFNALMGAFQEFGFQSEFGKKNFGYRIGMASPGQVAFIRKMWSEYHGGAVSDGGLNKWLEKHWKISALRFLEAWQAPEVIEVLKVMTRRRSRFKPVPDEVTAGEE